MKHLVGTNVKDNVNHHDPGVSVKPSATQRNSTKKEKMHVLVGVSLKPNQSWENVIKNVMMLLFGTGQELLLGIITTRNPIWGAQTTAKDAEISSSV